MHCAEGEPERKKEMLLRIKLVPCAGVTGYLAVSSS
jgi:hypothetical protein